MSRARTLVLVISTLALAIPSPSMAEWDVDGLEQLLPREETPAERAFREAWIAAGRPQLREPAADPPPLAPIRGCAEWEPLTGVLIRYPLGLPYALLRDFDDHLTIHVVVSSSLQGTAASNLSANGVDMSQVEYLVEPNNSIWTRDYGPWFVFDGNDELVVVDHVYNRPQRPADDLIPVAFANQQGIPVVRHDMWHTGGNYMTDGAAISSSTELVYDEASSANGMTPAQVDDLMLDYYGVNTYAVLDYIESGGIHHIDTWGKFLDEETVLLKEVWSSHHTYDDLEQRATLIASLTASTGRPYRVVRVYCHDIGGGRPASYTNSLIANERVYVPTFNSPANDAAAIIAYEEAMPGYDVRGHYYSGWLTDDALHCRAKGVMDAGMLRVAHVPVIEEQVGDVTVDVTVFDHSQSGITAVDLFYRQDDGSWTQVAMTGTGGYDYEATIPHPDLVATTEYYILASDASGRIEGMPRSAPAGFYSFIHGNTTTGVADGGAPDAIAETRARSPFQASTALTFELRRADHVEVRVVDARGRLVRELVDGALPSGSQRVEWDGRDAGGREVGAGVYYLVLRTAGIVHTSPVVLVP